mmetsp:Transcript_87929/g.179375  ORF Transcript_87929/g.179375 Transcript_87929/m.179375 type:complete len:963 (-) Transcript_87929:489-3377(-)
MENASSTGSTSDNHHNSHNNNHSTNTIFSMTMMSMNAGHHVHSSPIIRGTIAWCLRIRTLADALPAILQPVVSNGRMSVLVFFGGQFLLFLFWLPFWILSFVVSELGVYITAMCAIFLAGRAIIRMIAFPGSSHRVSNEIEKEFTKYSVRVITSSTTSLMELAVAIQGASGGNAPNYEIQSLWNRAKSYRDRVLGVYSEVLHTTLQDRNDISQGVGTVGSSGASLPNLNKYGNNYLLGDVGYLSGLTPEAVSDGRALLNHLENVLTQVANLEDHAKPFLENSLGGLTVSSRQAANSLLAAATELRNFVESLKLPSASGLTSSSSGDDDSDNLSTNELRRRLEEEQNNNGSIMDTVRMVTSSIIPMLDPPLHASIFGFDVLRGCVLSRYRGARQLWVQRPSGGRIDCLHIPAKCTASLGSNSGGMAASCGNSKAVMYCNPNAGLIEVATGMSLAGGNVASDVENIENDNCWTDFYTNAGFDVYLYNYAGFGRSYGGAFCGMLNGSNDAAYIPGTWGRIKRIFYGLFFSFGPTPDSLRADGFAVASHIISNAAVESLVIHGESIGGLAASGTARKLTENVHFRNKVSLLLCDRTFCNLEAVAQRLVGGWSGYAIRMLAPLWSTDIVGDFLAATCPKVVATDSADSIIADSSSLKAGIAFWKEIKRSASSTKGIGWMMDAPLHYRMADWENVCVTDSRYVVQPRTTRMTAPVWPADKHISINEAFHFAACSKRIGKLASIEKKRFSVMSSSGTLNTDPNRLDSCNAPIYLVWKDLGCCEGLCGSALGVTVKGGFDITVSWLCSMCAFGGQTVVEGMEHRRKWTLEEASTKLNELGHAEGSDFDCRPPYYENLETDAVVHPKPIPEVLNALRKIVEENQNDDILNSVSHEVAFVIGTLEYVVSRLSAPSTLETSWKSRHLNDNGSISEGSFMNLHCGHNNPFSKEERNRLRAVLNQVTQTPLPAVV